MVKQMLECTELTKLGRQCTALTWLVSSLVLQLIMLFADSPLPAGDIWLEVFSLPKETWLKELEPLQQMFEQSTTTDSEEELPSVSLPSFFVWLVSYIYRYIYISLSLFQRPFSRWTQVSRCLLEQRTMEVVLTTGAVSRASSSQIITANKWTPSLSQAGCPCPK